MTDYRHLPRVDDLVSALSSRLPRALATDVARRSLDEARTALSTGSEPDLEARLEEAIRVIEAMMGTRVVNASGVILHTNLGRAPWSREAVEAAARAGAGPENLELSLVSGERATRGAFTRELLRSLTGAEDALVVNNNAAAVLLALSAVAGSGAGVPVSRGELIEIGGAYRLPEMMNAGGARLIEVGTTNRTRPNDYRVALQVNQCAAILKVHTSNYRVVGFTEEATVAELGQVAGEAGVPLIFDAGSGLLDATTPWLPGPTPTWLAGEPGVRQSLQEGAAIVTFSADKLVGGPQAGVIVGDAEWVERLRDHPLARALRVDGVTHAALAATLRSYADGDAASRIPFWEQAMAPLGIIETRARALAARLDASVEPGFSVVGAGSAPGAGIETRLVVIRGGEATFTRLLENRPAVLARRIEGALALDLRTCQPEDDAVIEAAVARCLS